MTRHERRSSPRQEVLLHALLEPPEAEPLAVIVRDISAGGCCIEGGHDLVVGTRVGLTLPGLGRWPAELVWSDCERTGLRFQIPLHAALAGLLMQGRRPDLRRYVAKLASSLGRPGTAE